MSSKSIAISNALRNSGIVRNETNNQSNGYQTFATKPPNVSEGWARYPGNNPQKLSYDSLKVLKELYDLGKNNKKRTVSAERAHDILSNSILADKWDEKLILTVPRIKAFLPQPVASVILIRNYYKN